MESLLRNAADVVSVAGALEAMNDDNDGRVLGLPGLPMAMSEQSGLRIDLEELGFGGWDIKPPGDKSREDSHDVAIFEQRMRFKGREGEIHIGNVFHGGGPHKWKPARRERSGRSGPSCLRSGNFGYPLTYEFSYILAS